MIFEPEFETLPTGRLRALQGQHVNEDHFLPEVVDQETGEPAAPPSSRS